MALMIRDSLSGCASPRDLSLSLSLSQFDSHSLILLCVSMAMQQRDCIFNCVYLGESVGQILEVCVRYKAFKAEFLTQIWPVTH